MSQLTPEQTTLVQAAVNAVRIQLSANATPQERLRAGEVRIQSGRHLTSGIGRRVQRGRGAALLPLLGLLWASRALHRRPFCGIGIA